MSNKIKKALKYKHAHRHAHKKKNKHVNVLFFWVILLLIAGVAYKLFFLSPKQEPVSVIPPVSTSTQQFVLISFDGSKSLDIWKNIRNFKEEMKSLGIHLNVTHFVNAAYFLTSETKGIYKGPGKVSGVSSIGFSDNIGSLRERINEVNMAIADGDEIADHTAGHFSGAHWSKDEWSEELDSFDKIIFNLPTIYPNENLPELNFHRMDLVGFRAPYLDKSPGLYDALHEKHFLYDTSEITRNNLDWPKKDALGLWHIPLGVLTMNNSQVLSMDYNLFIKDSHGENSTLKKGTPEWDRVYKETLAAFLEYFNKNYNSMRAPVLMGYHFEVWNDGVYWEALKEFARKVCGLQDVKCGTFKELVNYMDSKENL